MTYRCARGAVNRKALTIGGIALALFLGGGTLVAVHWYDIVPRNWGVVEEGYIYRSGRLEEHWLNRLVTENDIEVVVSMNNYDPNSPYAQALDRASENLGLRVERYPMDGAGIPHLGDITMYADAVEAVHRARQAGEPVLIQCAAGVNRTGGVTAMYELLVEGDDAESVYAHMQRRKFTQENDRLLPYLNEHRYELARLLKQRGVIDEVPEEIPPIGPQ